MNELTEHVWGQSPAADRVWAQVCGLRPALAPGRPFMVLQAYIDDSQDESGVYVLAGYVSTAERWAGFSREWESMLDLGSLRGDGRRQFKMSEMALSPDRMSRVPGFHVLINKHAMLSVSCALNSHDITRAVNRLKLADFPDQKLYATESVFRICFNFLMKTFHEHLLSRPDYLKDINEPIDFYFDETGDKMEVLLGWEKYMGSLPNNERALYGGMPRFEDDRKYLPLQAADFRAWWVRKWVVDFGMDGSQRGTYSYTSAARRLPHLHIAATEEALVAGFKSSLRNDLGEDVRIEETIPFYNPDGPPPLSRLAVSVRDWLRKPRGRHSD